MTESDRIARLEERMNNLDSVIEEIKSAQTVTMKDIQTSAIDLVKLTGTLSELSKNLERHEDFHKEKGEKKYKVTDVILAVGMLLLGIMQFVDTKSPNKITYQSPSAVERIAEK